MAFGKDDQGKLMAHDWLDEVTNGHLHHAGQQNRQQTAQQRHIWLEKHHRHWQQGCYHAANYNTERRGA